MKLRFQKVLLDNFLSFEHAEIDLENRGYTLIEGVNQNPKDGAKSNGAGKSTIFSAVCYALTGETIQGLSSSLNNIITGGDMSVTLYFLKDTDKFKIIRGRGADGKADLRIWVNGENKSGKGVRESQDILNNLLPEITSDLIGGVIIVGQGMPHKFSANTPSGRKDLLEKLSHSDYMLDDIKTRVEGRIAKLTGDKNNSTLEQKEKEASKRVLETEIDRYKAESLKFVNKPDFEGQIKEIESLIEKDKKSVEVIQKELGSKRISLESLNQELLELTNKRNNEINDETDVFNTFNLKVKTEITEKETQRKTLLEEIKKLKAIKDVCPMCHQKIPHVHKRDTTAQEKEVTLLNESLTTLKEKDSVQQQNYQLNVKDIKAKYEKEEDGLNATKNAAQETINSLNTSITKINARISDNTIKLNKIINEEKTFENQRVKCCEEIKRLEGEKETLDTALLYNIKQIQEAERHLETITKINTLIKRDFRGILLSSVISYINEKCKEYAADIFGTQELEFKLDGNNISITYLNKPLEALSGGEQQKVDLILQFALRAMMQEYTGFTSNIIVLDEILDNLDSVGCDAVLNFITNKLSDIESVFIISHHSDSLNIGNDSTITVLKDARGVSHIL